MKFYSFLIKYGEIGLKGKNRYKFEDTLVNNIRLHLANHLQNFVVYKEQERVYVDINEEYNYQKILDTLKRIFGIYSISPVHKIDFTTNYKELSTTIINYVNEIYGKSEKKSFKIKTRRVNKRFPMHSDTINAELGHDVLENFKNFTVDVHNPNVLINVEIRNHINIYSEVINGAKGLPTGTSSKSLLLLSGGIDSPVAGFLIAKRGVIVEAIYFNAPPYTSDRAKDKVIKLAEILSRYTGCVKLHIVNFTDIQLEIYDKCPHDELTIIMRRLMMKISEMVAKENNCLALITGESIGQVASQTTNSIAVTNECVNMPIFRPLIGFDKEEIIKIAENIGTFNTSILPYEDCCTIFVAKHPVTNPNLEKILKSEKNLEKIDDFIKIAINNIETIICKSME